MKLNLFKAIEEKRKKLHLVSQEESKDDEMTISNDDK